MNILFPGLLSIALGLSAIDTGLRIMPLSITLVIAAVGIPKLFPQASPRLICRIGFFALFLGLVVHYLFASMATFVAAFVPVSCEVAVTV